MYSKIDSQSYKYVGKRYTPQITTRNFDYAPSQFSTEFDAKMEEASSNIFGYLSASGSGKDVGLPYRYASDIVMASALNRPYEEVAQNHDKYMLMFTGTHIEDKSFLEAIGNAWESENVSRKIAQYQNMIDSSDDNEEILKLTEKIEDQEKKLIKLQDYSDRGWLQNTLIDTAPIFNQLSRTVLWSTAGAAIGAGVSMLTGGLGSAAAAGSWLTKAHAILKASTAVTNVSKAVSAGRLVGTVADAAINVYGRERGQMSRDLSKLIDHNGAPMDADTRKSMSSLYALLATAIEFATPEVGFGDLLLGSSGRNIANKTVQAYAKRWLAGTLQGGISESIEESLQSLANDMITSASLEKANSNKNYYTDKKINEYKANALANAATTFLDMLGPSLITGGITGGVRTLAEANTRNAMTSNGIIYDTTLEQKQSARNAQSETSKSMIVDMDLINLKGGRVSQEYKVMQSENRQSSLLPPVVVTLDERTGRFTPIDQENANLAKLLFNEGRTGIIIENVADQQTFISNKDVENVASDMGAFIDEDEIIFSNINDASSYIETLGNDIITTKIDDNTFSVEYSDKDGNTFNKTIKIDPEMSEMVNEEIDAANKGENSPVYKTRNASSENIETDETKFRKFLQSVFRNNVKGGNRSLRNSIKLKTLNTGTEALTLLSKATGLSADEIIGKKIAINVIFNDDLIPKSNRTVRGWVSMPNDSDGVYTINLTRNANERTMVHEVAHIMRRLLTPEQLKAFSTEYGLSENGTWITDIKEKDGKFYLGDAEFETRNEALEIAKEAEEKFARDFEKYVSEGISPIPQLQEIFSKMKTFIANLLKSNYSDLNDNLRKAYDEIFKNAATNENSYSADEILMQSDERRNKAKRIARNASRYQDSGTNVLRNIEDSEFISNIDKGVFTPTYVLNSKYNNSNDEKVREKAKQELEDREIMNAVPQKDKDMISHAKNEDDFINMVNSTGEEQLNSDLERIYRKMYRYSMTPTVNEQVKAFKTVFGSLNGLLSLKDIIGKKTVSVTTKYGRKYIRNYVASNNIPYNMLKNISENSSLEEVNNVFRSIDSSPRMWLDSYYKYSNTKIPGMDIPNNITVSDLMNYVRMNSDAFELVDNIKGARDHSESISLEDPEISSQQVKDAETGNSEAQPILEKEISEIEDALKIASKQVVRLRSDLDKANTDLETALREKAKLQSEYDEVQASRNVLSKIVESKIEQSRNLQNSIDSEKQKARRKLYEQNKKSEKELDELKKKKDEEISRLRDLKNSIAQDLENSLKRESTLKERLKKSKSAFRLYKLNRRIRRALSFNSSTHDAMYEDVIYYVYSLMHDGQKRRYTDTFTDHDYDMSRLGKGEEDNTRIIRLDKMDSDGNLLIINQDTGETLGFDASLGSYRFERNQIPEMLAKYLDEDTKKHIKESSQWASLTLSDVEMLTVAIEQAKREVRDLMDIKKNNYYSKLIKNGNDFREAIFGRTLDNALNDDLKYRIAQHFKVDSFEDVTPEQYAQYKNQHPSAFTPKVEVGKFKSVINTINNSYLKMQTMARKLDGNKEGIFTKVFVDDAVKSYQRFKKNETRRIEHSNSEFDKILGSAKSETRKTNIKELQKEMEFTLNAPGATVNLSGWNQLGVYIYSKNINGFSKLISTSGNNLSLETIARINPEALAKFVNLEIENRNLIEKDRRFREDNNLVENDYARTLLNYVKQEDLEKLKADLDSGKYQSVLSETSRRLGDKMIGLLLEEMPRYANSVYDLYNIRLSLQEDYFPLVAKTRMSVGEIMRSLKPQQKNVSKGNAALRQADARYELLLDPVSVYYSAIRNQEKLINMGGSIKEMNNMLSSHGENVYGMLENKYGRQTADFFQNYVNRLAGEENTLTDYERLMNLALGNIASAKLGLNVLTTVKQFFSIIPAITNGDINGTDLARIVPDFINNHSEWMRTIKELAPELYDTSMNVEYARTVEMKNISNADKISSRIRNTMMLPISWADKGTKYIIWAASFDKGLRNGLSQQQAALNATKLIQRTQSVSDLISLSSLQANKNPLTRLAFMFTNDLFQMWNVLFGTVMDFKTGMTWQGMQKAVGIMLTAGALALASGKILPDKDGDDEPDWEALGSEYITQFIQYLVPIGGVALGDVFSGWNSPFWQFPTEAYNTSKMIYYSFKNDKDYSVDDWVDQIIDDITTGVEPIFPLPTTMISRSKDTFFPEGINGGIGLNLGYFVAGTTWGNGLKNLLD